MQAIQTTVVVDGDRKMTVQLPAEIVPGTHRVVVVLEGTSSQRAQSWTMEDWPIHDAGLIDASFTMRREDLYGDHGR